MNVRLGGRTSGLEAADYIIHELKIPVIFLTAKADEETLERFDYAGTPAATVGPGRQVSAQGLHAIEVVSRAHLIEPFQIVVVR